MIGRIFIQAFGKTIASNIAVMIMIIVCAVAHMRAAYIAEVILVRIFAIGQPLLAVIAEMVFVRICAFACDIAAYIAGVILVRIFAVGQPLYAVIAEMILVRICAFADCLGASVVAGVILVCICVHSINQSATAIAVVIFVEIGVRLHVGQILSIRVRNGAFVAKAIVIDVPMLTNGRATASAGNAAACQNHAENQEHKKQA